MSQAPLRSSAASGEHGPAPLDLLYSLAIVLFVGIASWALVDHALLLQRTVVAPYPLSYSEGLSIDRALQLPDLRALYPAVFEAPPLRISPEPPLFPALLAAFGRQADAASTLGTWRSLSLAAYAVAGLAAAAAAFGMARSIGGAAVAGLLLWLFPQLQNASALAAPDAAALAFSMCGLALAALLGASPHPRRRAIALLAAGACFVAALGTQPRCVVAPLAGACSWLLVHERRRAAIALPVGVTVTAALAALALQQATDGAFLAHIFDYGVRLWSKNDAMRMVLNQMLRSGLIFVPCVMFFVTEPLGARHIAARPTLAMLATAFIFTIIDSRQGSGWAITLPLSAVTCVAFGVVLGWLRPQRWLAILAVVFALLQIDTLKEWRATEFIPDLLRRLNQAPDIAKLNARLLAAQGPVLTDEHIGTLALAGRPSVIYPLEFNALHQRGRWSTASLIAAIDRREFAMIAWFEPLDRGDHLIITRWPEDVRKAVYRNYLDSSYLADTVTYQPTPP